MKINEREIEVTEKSIRILRNDEDNKYMKSQKVYGHKRYINETIKARDEIENTEEFKQLIKKFNENGHQVKRASATLQSDEDIDKYIEKYEVI